MATRLIYLQDTGVLSIDSQRDYKNINYSETNQDISGSVPFPTFVDFNGNSQIKSSLIFTTDLIVPKGSVLLYEPSYFPINKVLGSLKISSDSNSNWLESFGIVSENILPLLSTSTQQSFFLVEYLIDKTKNISTDITKKKIDISYIPFSQLSPLDSYYMAGANGDLKDQSSFKVRNLDETNGVLTSSKFYSIPEDVKLRFYVYEKAKCILNISWGLSDNIDRNWTKSINIKTRRAYTTISDGLDNEAGNIFYAEDESIGISCYNIIEDLDNLGVSTTNYSQSGAIQGWSSSFPTKSSSIGFFKKEGVYRLKNIVKGNGDTYNNTSGYNQDMKTVTFIVVPNSEPQTTTDNWNVGFDITGNLIINPIMSITPDPNNLIDTGSLATLTTIGNTSISCYPDLNYSSATLIVSYGTGVNTTLKKLDNRDLDKTWVAYLEALYTVTCLLINSTTLETIDSKEGFGNLIYNTNGSISTKSIGHTFYNIQPNTDTYKVIYTLTPKEIK